MKGALRFMVMFLAVFSFGAMVLPTHAMAGTNFSISVDAYPVSFTFSDTQPERVYVERQVTHNNHRDYRPYYHGCRYQPVYHGRGHYYPSHRYGRNQGYPRWGYR